MCVEGERGEEKEGRKTRLRDRKGTSGRPEARSRQGARTQLLEASCCSSACPSSQRFLTWTTDLISR
ncbi:hypothetical protein PI124_g3765 [Phytophthora idaei]|nr:hypothetical protein PI125_g6220 [Phytophthora idaei]KAG3168733.1 hypothetical protein PI126_g3190 [Phytophthora idaei]KAG3251658.1 hypothetical protein PI124_g3765 [Phytophthora idaei]